MSQPQFNDNSHHLDQESPGRNPNEDENMLDDDEEDYLSAQGGGRGGVGAHPFINEGNYNNFFKANQWVLSELDENDRFCPLKEPTVYF